MIILIKVELANNLDDSNRTVILACDSSDSNVRNNLRSMAEMFVDRIEWNGEYIDRVTEIEPINVSSDKESSDIVRSVFN